MNLSVLETLKQAGTGLLIKQKEPERSFIVIIYINTNSVKDIIAAGPFEENPVNDA